MTLPLGKTHNKNPYSASKETENSGLTKASKNEKKKQFISRHLS